MGTVNDVCLLAMSVSTVDLYSAITQSP